MRICAYVQEQYAKSTYSNECMDTRQFVGLRVVMDSLQRAGYEVEWAGIATVHEYDVVLVSLTSDCDWWSFIAERMRWRKGHYKVIIGGAGVLHVTPFLQWADYFSLGRGEESMPNLIRMLDGQPYVHDDSIIESATFSPDRVYHIRQTDICYPHKIRLTGDKNFQENAIGCNHRCLFCGYTWQRKFVSPNRYYAMEDSLFGDIADKERAMLDIERDPGSVNFSKLRTTAIDGFSERLRYMVNKRISKRCMTDFLVRMMQSDAKPHQLKFYNICGYPTETMDDWKEYIDTLSEADEIVSKTSNGKQWSIVLHNTPFRAMPATPMACAPMSKMNYRGKIGSTLGKGLKGGIIYQGKHLWSVESMGTDSLSTVMLSAICHRGDASDADNIARICASKKFWTASSAVKEATLSKYFDMDHLFGELTAKTLPSRYLRTYCRVEDMWTRPAWSDEYRIKPV